MQGRVGAEGYAVFGVTALWAWLASLWASFVMPRIGWLTLVLAAFEIDVGVCLLLRGRPTRIAVIAILAFFSFILVLGYGFPAANLAEDLLKNRVFTVMIAGLLISALAQRNPPHIVAAWHRFSHRSHSRHGARSGLTP